MLDVGVRYKLISQVIKERNISVLSDVALIKTHYD